MAALKGGEHIRGDVITENTMATASYRINARVPIYNPLLHSPVTHKAAARKAQKKAEEFLLNAPSRPSTDLMNAFQLADKLFNGVEWKNAKSKVLVVFSDMIESSKQYDFVTEKFGEARVKQILATEREHHRLPDLKDVDVWVAGATAAESGGLTPARIYKVQDFWLRYFKECGARLTKERYATTLLNFRLP